MAAPVKIDDAATLKPLKPTPVHLIGSTLAATLSARAKLKPIRPGVERWPVKTGTDEDVAAVQTGFVDTTVEDLINEPRPHDMRPVQDNFPSYQSRRAFGVETTIYRLEAEIIAYKMESDGDYHLVIQGDTGNTMIAECPKPDPAFVDPSSPWVGAIQKVRAALDAKLVPAPAQHIQKARIRARITGVGFFDRVHDQTGVSLRNGIELHPILGIEFP